jgi:excinuclease ABC subunit C
VRSSAALRLLQRIRDEAHRFAVGYNRKLRAKRTLRSELGEIPGIGPTRQTALLRHFGSVRALREASEETIASVPGFSRRLADIVHGHLHSAQSPAVSRQPSADQQADSDG